MAAPDRHRVVALAPDTIAEGVRRLGWIALVYAIGSHALRMSLNAARCVTEGDFDYGMELLEGISVERNTVCGGTA